MDNLDLDQARAARREGRKRPPTITFKGETFKLPLKLSWDVYEALDHDRFADAIELLFGEEYERFRALKPEFDDVRDIAKNLGPLYGLKVGESSASGASSRTPGARSRQTSNGSTD